MCFALAGIYHGQLDNINDSHFLFAADNTVCIVGFSRAHLHTCRKIYPTYLKGNTKSPTKGCDELETLDKFVDHPFTTSGRGPPLSPGHDEATSHDK